MTRLVALWGRYPALMPWDSRSLSISAYVVLDYLRGLEVVKKRMEAP